MPDQLQVELVAADRLVWSGEATMVIARTAEGDIGILRNHAPVLSVLVEGVVEIQTDDGDDRGRGRRRGLPLGGATTGSRSCPSTPSCPHEIDVEEARAELENVPGCRRGRRRRPRPPSGGPRPASGRPSKAS